MALFFSLQKFSLAFLICGFNAVLAKDCLFPGTPRHATLLRNATNSFPPNSTITYECDPGYDLLGSRTRTCVAGLWLPKGHPFCARDVATGKPTASLPNEGGTSVVVDGNNETCWSTRELKGERVFAVDIIENVRVEALKIVFGEDLDKAQVEVRLGNINPVESDTFNSICKQFSVDFKAQAPYYFQCNKNTTMGRYLSVHVKSDTPSVLSLCEVEVHSETALSKSDACPQGHKDAIKAVFNGTCYEFHQNDTMNFTEGETTCRQHGGELVKVLEERTFHFLTWKTSHIFNSDSIWMDAMNNNGSWTWLDGDVVEDLEFPKADVEEENGRKCLAMDSSGHRVSGEDCSSRIRVVCQYKPVSCGRPHLPKGLANWSTFGKILTGETVKGFECSPDFFPTSDDGFHCESNGTILGNPKCHPFPCGAPPILINGTYKGVNESYVEYSCQLGFIMIGDPVSKCTNSSWSSAPKCAAILDFVKEELVVVEEKVEKSINSQVKTTMQKLRSFTLLEQLAFGGGLIAAALLLFVVFMKCVCCLCAPKKDKVSSPRCNLEDSNDKMMRNLYAAKWRGRLDSPIRTHYTDSSESNKFH